MVYTRSEVENRIKPIVMKHADIFDRVVLFGSYAREEQNEKSDIDLYIESEMTTGKILTCKKYRDFHLELYRSFDNMEFDLLVFGGKRDRKSVRDSKLYRQVLKDGVTIYDKGTETL
ncbi:MAG: nucleotidyltransferase domain-containing protein [Lachnospiraceae bacterium]|nr:nucleotidyltransferase domain-containing protein [Lachnospiraceae bacterium]